MIYPNDWSEFEDGEGSFLFIIPKSGLVISVFLLINLVVRRRATWITVVSS